VIGSAISSETAGSPPATAFTLGVPNETLKHTDYSKITQFFPKSFDGEGSEDCAKGHWLLFEDFLEHHNIKNDE
jgi:hypothetical protein